MTEDASLSRTLSMIPTTRKETFINLLLLKLGCLLKSCQRLNMYLRFRSSLKLFKTLLETVASVLIDQDMFLFQWSLMERLIHWVA